MLKAEIQELKKLYNQKVDLTRLKQLAREKLDLNSPLRELLLLENENLGGQEFLAKLDLWLKLLSRKEAIKS
jgi:hypothetical protein